MASAWSLTNGLFKTIFILNYHMNLKVSSGRPKQWICSIVYPCVTDTQPFQDHLATKPIISTQGSLSQETGSKPCLPGNLNNECEDLRFPSITDEWPFQDHLETKTVILTQSSVSQENTLKLLSPERMAQSFVPQETWTMNVHSQGFYSVTDEWPFQEHFANKTIDLKFCIPREWPEALSLKRPEQWMCTAEALPVSSRNSLFMDIFQVCLSYWLGELSPGRSGQRCSGFPVSVMNTY